MTFEQRREVGREEPQGKLFRQRDSAGQSQSCLWNPEMLREVTGRAAGEGLW